MLTYSIVYLDQGATMNIRTGLAAIRSHFATSAILGWLAAITCSCVVPSLSPQGANVRRRRLTDRSELASCTPMGEASASRGFTWDAHNAVITLSNQAAERGANAMWVDSTGTASVSAKLYTCPPSSTPPVVETTNTAYVGPIQVK
jgi:hypothetical protein